MHYVNLKYFVRVFFWSAVVRRELRTHERAGFQGSTLCVTVYTSTVRYLGRYPTVESMPHRYAMSAGSLAGLPSPLRERATYGVGSRYNTVQSVVHTACTQQSRTRHYKGPTSIYVLQNSC